MEEGLPIGTAEIQVGAGIQQLLDDRLVAAIDGKAQRTVRLAIAVIDVGAPLDQKRHHLSLFPHGRNIERRAVVAIAGVDVRSRLEQQPGDLDIARCRSDLDGELAKLAVVALVYRARIIFEDLFDAGHVTGLDGSVDVAAQCGQCRAQQDRDDRQQSHAFNHG